MLAFDGVVLGDLSVPCEIFGRAPERAYEVRVCSLAPTVRTAHVALTVPRRLATLRRADVVIVPGVDDLDRPIPPTVVRALRAAIERGAVVASICTGAFVLAATGALDGHRATTHWASAAEFARRYPRIAVDAGVLYVDNGALLTSAGAAAGLDLCIHLVRRDLGADAAGQVARAAVMPLAREGGQAQFITHEPPRDDGATLEPLLVWAEAHLADDLTLPRLARRAATSTRTLSRRFRDQIGATPAAWVKRARVRRAQHLLETTDLSIERLAAEAGFASTTVLRDSFRGLVGTSPQAYRRAFRLRDAPAGSP